MMRSWWGHNKIIEDLCDPYALTHHLVGGVCTIRGCGDWHVVHAAPTRCPSPSEYRSLTNWVRLQVHERSGPRDRHGNHGDNLGFLPLYSHLISPCVIGGFLPQAKKYIPSNMSFKPMLVQCWAIVVNAGPTLNQHWIRVTCFWDVCVRKMELHNPAATMHLSNVGLTLASRLWRWASINPTLRLVHKKQANLVVSWHWFYY